MAFHTFRELPAIKETVPAEAPSPSSGEGDLMRYLLRVWLIIIMIIFWAFGFVETAYCVGASSSEIGTQAFPQFLNIPGHDCRSVLFSTWQDLEAILDTCGQRKLPCASDCFELVSQLQPAQLSSLVNSIELKLPEVDEAGAVIQELTRILVELKGATNHMLKFFRQELIPGLELVTGVSTPLSMPLEERIDLLLQLPISRGAQSHYASQIFHQTQSLIKVYQSLFGLLPSTPNVIFPEDIQNMELEEFIEISPSETEAIQAIHERFRQTIRIVLRFHSLRKQIREGLKRQRRF